METYKAILAENSDAVHRNATSNTISRNTSFNLCLVWSTKKFYDYKVVHL